MNDVVVRFAPSPTGFLHIGGIRTALINYIVVQQSKKKDPKSKLLLRIEDTDITRSKDEYKKSILDGLEWMGIEWDEKPHIQSESIDRHKEIAFKLLEKGHAYKCVCTKEELETRRLENQKLRKNIKRLCTKCKNDSATQQLEKDFCIRINIPNDGKISVLDKIQGLVVVENKEIDNFILLRKDGTPTYMLSVVVDDHDMGVNIIIRGDDHLNNIFRQLHIYKSLKWDLPTYAHHPLIHGDDGLKLSKRHGAVDINEFKKKGYLPQAIINNLILLSWSPKKNDENIEIGEIINTFDLEKMSKSSSIFDYNKLNHFNNFYLQKEENYKYFEEFVNENSILKNFFDIDKILMKKLFNTYKKNINFYSELENISKIYYDEEFKTILNNELDDNFNIILNDFMKHLDFIDVWSKDNLKNCINKFLELKKIKFPILGKPLRIVLTNLKEGPPINDILFILGRKNTFLRLNSYINSANKS